MATLGSRTLRREPSSGAFAAARNAPEGFTWLLLVLLAASLAPSSRAQRPYPLTGSDAPLPVDNTTGAPQHISVYVTVLLERVVQLDEEANGYGAIWWVVLTWADPTAGATVVASTARSLRPNESCVRPCDSGGLASMGCCDGMWLPHIELPNIITYSDDQLPRYRINANATSGTVTWSTRLVGHWYAPLDYRAYPFDHQHLLLELAIADSQAPVAGLKWQHVAQLNNTAHTKGADVSGWRIKWSKGKVYDSRPCYKAHGITAPSYDTAPGLVQPSTGNTSADQVSVSYTTVALSNRYLPDNRAAGTTTPSGCGSYHDVYDEARALYGPVVLVADIMIKRVASYYILTNLIPVLLITFVAFVVFFMPQDALGDRMSVVLTMFLSLTAMQFVFDFPPANYINALQMVVLVSYIMIALACVESLVVNRVATVSEMVTNKRTCVRKYSGLLAKGNLDRHLSRELFSKAHAVGGQAPHGGRTHVRTWVRSHAPLVPAGPKGGAQGTAAKPPSAAAGPAAGPGPATGGPRREDSAIEGQHLLSAAVPAPAEATLATVPDTPAAAADPITIPTAAAAASVPRVPRSLRVNFSSNSAPSSLPNIKRIASVASASGAVGSAGGSAAAAASPPLARRRAGSTAGSVCGDPAGSVCGDLPADSVAGVPAAAAAANGGPTGAVPLTSPFASGRTHVEEGVPMVPIVHDARSICSGGSRASMVGTVAANVRSMCRRCWALGFWTSLRAVLVAFATWLAAVAAAPVWYYRQCKEDPAFARFVAVRIDKWSCIVSVTLYVICITVLLWVEVKVGDHKLMLGDRPGNM